MKAASTIQIADPDGNLVVNPTLTPLALADPTADPNADPATYKITWSGPWITTNSSENATYRKRGDYKVMAKGVKADDSTIDSDPADPNGTVSLVEVTKVELCQADDTDECAPLTTPQPDVSADNPAVSKIGAEDPAQSRPAEGKRVFAEAPLREGTILNRVKVRATIDPEIPVDALRLATAVSVPVYFESFDVDLRGHLKTGH